MSRRKLQWLRTITQARYEPNPSGGGNIRVAKTKEQAAGMIVCRHPKSALFAALVKKVYG